MYVIDYLPQPSAGGGEDLARAPGRSVVRQTEWLARMPMSVTGEGAACTG